VVTDELVQFRVEEADIQYIALKLSRRRIEEPK
jgi:hypothetical protein